MIRSLCFIVSIIILFSSTGKAVEQSLLDPAFQWKSGAGGKSTIDVVSQNPLIAEVSVGGGSEGFPGLKLALPKEADWRGFGKIHCEVKLESDDPGLKSGGKEFAFCLYDNDLRHEVLDGHPHVQQVFARLKVHEGDWQEAIVDLTPAVRGKITYFDICLYDMPYNYPHKYKVSFRRLRLAGDDPNRTFFDQVSYPVSSLKGLKEKAKDKAGTLAGILTTADGLAMTLAQNGGILNVSTGGKSVGNGDRQISGILLRDARTDSPPVMAGGILKEKNEGFHQIHQISELKELNLTLNANYRAEKNRLVIDGRVDSTNNEDRAVTVYVAIPVSDGSWRWHQSLSRSLLPFEEMKALPQFEDSFSKYPLAVLSDPKSNRGIGLILDQGRPVVYRFGINPREKLLYAAFDFALLNQENHQGKSQRGADFHLEIVRTDPTWGFRSGVEKLYALHPEHFVDRVGFGGGWELGGYRTKNTVEQNIAGGYRFDWNAADNTKDIWEWNVQNKIVNLIYIEPDFLQFSMGDFASPTVTETQTRLDKLTANEEAEWKTFLELHYSKAFNCNAHPKVCDLRNFLLALLQSIQVSGMFDREGTPLLGLGYRPGWIGNSGFGAMIPANLAPGIPGGRGETILKVCLDDFYNEYVANGWTRPGGFGLDCFMDVPNDYRRENFQYMTTPLSFDPETKQPMIPRGFGSIEWLKELKARYADRNAVIMANAFGPMTFAAPALDIFGIENTLVYDPEFYRVIAGPKKPITFLPYDPPPLQKLEQHLSWGIYPGRAVSPETLAPLIPVLDTLYQAAWQPVTGVWSDSPLQIERFGTADDEFLYLTLYNPAETEISAELIFDTTIIGNHQQIQVFHNGNQTIPMKKNRFQVKMTAKETKVLRLSAAVISY